MTIPQRLKLVMALAGVFYLAVIGAGLAGFDLAIWGVIVLLFFLWHLLMHEPTQGTGWLKVAAIHGALGAILLWAGHGIGSLTGLTPSPIYGIVVALAAIGAAWSFKLSPDEHRDFVRMLDESRQTMQAAAAAARAAAPAVDWRNELTPAEAAKIDEVLHEVNGQGGSSGSDAMKPLVARLRAAGPTDLVLERLEQGGDHDLPAIRLQAAFALSPAAAQNLIGGGALDAALRKVLATDDGDAVEASAAEAATLVEQVPDAAPFLPDDAELRAEATRLDAVHRGAADALRHLAQRIVEARRD